MKPLPGRSLLQTKGNETRYLLDTNIWRYVVDAGEQSSLVDLARSNKVSVQVSPATVNETLRLRDKALMRKIVRLQTKPCFVRLPAEALIMAVELMLEINRLHPDWMRRDPDYKQFKKWSDFWYENWWKRVRRSPDQEAKMLRGWEGDLLDRAREITREQRKGMRETGPRHNYLPMDTWYVEVPYPFPGWRGINRVDAWRIETLISLTNGMVMFRNGMRPILETIVDLSRGLVSSEEWQIFWLYETEKGNLVRFWLEWLHGFAANFRKITPGTPGDTQLFTYLPDTDVFVSADKGILQILEEVRAYSPVDLPRGLLIKGGRAGVGTLLTELRSQ